MFDFGLYSTYLFKFFCIVCGNAQGDDVGAYLNILSLLDFRTLDPRLPLPPRGWGGGLNLLTPGDVLSETQGDAGPILQILNAIY